ncbi:MAG: hypothetical protein ACYC97_01390 [Metallibacterium sp.]
MDLLTRQRIGHALAALLSAGLFLYGGLILLPKAWLRLGRRERAVSGVILAGCAVLFALTWIPQAPAHGYFSAIMFLTLGLGWFATMGLEWEIPRQTTLLPAARRRQGWLGGSAFLLMGSGNLAWSLQHDASMQFLLLGLAIVMLVLATVLRGRGAQSPR